MTTCDHVWATVNANMYGWTPQEDEHFQFEMCSKCWKGKDEQRL